ncbi:hypothetical protein BK120_33885 [Paenibacillus sp. FSL A5-0031]|uniref:hypothetical protein n=1 Tax=Paenibacillus sp. FSL A5-0031 TaxID=1920420 RepID=UPI00096C4272|nr:hypothetical protein [Paenibacillus sp. FSL A5-0031]OME69175.1 hypothetical protein BK120_33885 [Paenibacillus sp. FSL A5-0031]
MRINLNRLRESLPKRDEYQQSYSPGLFRAIDIAHHNTDSASVDWSSFTLSEAEQALDHAMNYVDSEYTDYELEHDSDAEQCPNEGNAIHEFLHNTEVVFAIKHSVPEKQTENVEFF